MINLVQPKDIKLTENSFKLKETLTETSLIESAKTFQDNLRVIFVEKAPEVKF